MITKLYDWQSNEQLVAWAHKVFSSAEWELITKIMERDQHVRHQPQQCEASQKLGRIEGWDLFAARLSQFAEPVQITDIGEPTFEPPDPVKKEEAA